MKNSNDNIGNRTRDLLTCSAVPQPTAPPWSPMQRNKLSNWPNKLFFCTLRYTDQHSITAANFTFQDKQNNTFYSVIILKLFTCYSVQHITVLAYFYVTVFLMISEGVIKCLLFTGRQHSNDGTSNICVLSFVQLFC